MLPLPRRHWQSTAPKLVRPAGARGGPQVHDSRYCSYAVVRSSGSRLSNGVPYDGLVADAPYPLWTVHVADLKTRGVVQACARCGEAIVNDPDLVWPRGRLVAMRNFGGRRLEIRLIDWRDDLLEDERPCDAM